MPAKTKWRRTNAARNARARRLGGVSKTRLRAEGGGGATFDLYRWRGRSARRPLFRCALSWRVFVVHFSRSIGRSRCLDAAECRWEASQKEWVAKQRGGGRGRGGRGEGRESGPSLRRWTSNGCSRDLKKWLSDETFFGQKCFSLHVNKHFDMVVWCRWKSPVRKNYKYNVHVIDFYVYATHFYVADDSLIRWCHSAKEYCHFFVGIFN